MTTTKTFLVALRAKGACSGGYAWARESKATSAADAWARLPRADWMLWVAQNFKIELDAGLLRQYAFACADRAIHVHAVAALRSANLAAEADRLDAVAPITDERAAADASAAAWAAADASAAAWAAADASGAARDASAAAAARAAAWATEDAAWAAELLWQADRLRAIFPAVGSVPA